MTSGYKLSPSPCVGTTVGTTAGAACVLTDGMSSPAAIPDNRISSEPASPDVDNVRPNSADKWTISSESSPSVVIGLVEAGKEPIPLGRVEVTSENVAQITVEYRPDAQGEFTALKKKDSDDNQVRRTDANHLWLPGATCIKVAVVLAGQPRN